MRGKSGSRLNFVAFDKVLALLRDLEPSDDRPTQMDYRYYRKLQELAFCTLVANTAVQRTRRHRSLLDREARPLALVPSLRSGTH